MSEKWSEDELKAAVLAYVEMREKQASGEKFVKKEYYASLHKSYGRTLKSYEYRMQNISHVFELQGRSWVKGLAPLRNVGSNVIGKLEQLIAEAEGQELGTNAAFHSSVAKTKAKAEKPPKGNLKPPTQKKPVTQFIRDPEVVAWVLSIAKGHCEICTLPAPFTRTDGSPFLEVHHIIRLADGGSDTVNNAVAACPNCHRHLHYGADRELVADKLRETIPRLGEVHP